MLRPGAPLADTDGVLDRCGDVNGCLRIGLAHRSGDGIGVRALVVCRAAYDGVERRRQRGDDLVGVLVEGNPDHENPALRAMDCLKACQRLPDAIGGVANVDHGERVLLDRFEASRPTRLPQAPAPRGSRFCSCCYRSRLFPTPPEGIITPPRTTYLTLHQD